MGWIHCKYKYTLIKNNTFIFITEGAFAPPSNVGRIRGDTIQLCPTRDPREIRESIHDYRVWQWGTSVDKTTTKTKYEKL